jgi:hypothetical protein
MSSTARYVRWQDRDMWLGYFEQFPDYLTQGETHELEENLRDLYRDLRSGDIPGIRSIAELDIAVVAQNKKPRRDRQGADSANTVIP